MGLQPGCLGGDAGCRHRAWLDRLSGLCVVLRGLTGDQMRVGCANQLRKHGYSEHDVEDMAHTRLAVEGFLRGGRNRTSVQALLNRASAQPWFARAYVSPVLPTAPGTWRDMDYDPQPALNRLACPVLASTARATNGCPSQRA